MQNKSLNTEKPTADMNFDFSGKHPYLQAVEDLLGGVNRKIFADGTQQFADDNLIYIYSPRLPEDALEDFCRKNIEIYKEISKNNAQAVADMEDFEIEYFWKLTLTQEQKNQLTLDFTKRCDDFIDKRMQLVGDKEDIKYNSLPDWQNHRDIQQQYFNEEFDEESKKFLDKLLTKTYKRYNDQAKTGFGRIRINK